MYICMCFGDVSHSLLPMTLVADVLENVLNNSELSSLYVWKNGSYLSYININGLYLEGKLPTVHFASFPHFIFINENDLLGSSSLSLFLWVICVVETKL